MASISLFNQECTCQNKDNTNQPKIVTDVITMFDEKTKGTPPSLLVPVVAGIAGLISWEFLT